MLRSYFKILPGILQGSSDFNRLRYLCQVKTLPFEVSKPKENSSSVVKRVSIEMEKPPSPASSPPRKAAKLEPVDPDFDVVSGPSKSTPSGAPAVIKGETVDPDVKVNAEPGPFKSPAVAKMETTNDADVKKETVDVDAKMEASDADADAKVINEPEPDAEVTTGTQTDYLQDVLRIGAVDDTPTLLAGGPPSKRKVVATTDEPDSAISREIKKAKLETKALKAKRPGFTDERYNETAYYVENGLRKVYPYYFTFTTFTKGRWVGEKILDVFAKEFRAHPVEEYERCIKSGTLTVNYTKVDTDYRLKHNDLLANIVHRHEVPVTSDPIEVVHMDEDLVVVNKPASIPVHPCGRYRHNTVVFILAKEHQLKNLRTIHRLDRLTSGLLLFGRSPKKAREMEQQIRNRLVSKEYVCRVEGVFPDDEIECSEPIEVVSYKIGVCKVSKDGKECKTVFKKLSCNGKTSVVLARPRTGRMHQIRVHLQFLGYPIVNDPLYNHPVFGLEKGKGGLIGKTDEQLIQELISIHNAENWLGIEGEEGGGGGGGGVGDMFGAAVTAPGGGGVVPGNDVASCHHLNTINGPSSCTSIQSDNGSSIGSLAGDGQVELNGNNNNSTPSSLHSNNEPVPENMKNEETQVAFPLIEKEVENTGIMGGGGGGGKVTVGTQTNDEDNVVTNNGVISPPTHLVNDSSNADLANSLSTSTSASAQTQQGMNMLDGDCISNGSQTITNVVKYEEGTSPGSTGSNNNRVDNSSTPPSKLCAPPGFRNEHMTYDPHCYECKVRYRDPKPKDLVMYLHALTYKGPGWGYETKMPNWASSDWLEPEES